MTTPLPPTHFGDLVEALKRELAVPGEFTNLFPNTTDTDLTNKLADAAAMAQLDGFFGTQTIDPAASTITPGVSSGGGALIILYAAESVIRAQIRALKTHTKYESAGSIYEVEQSANVLTSELAFVKERRLELLALIRRQLRANRAVYVSDGYLIRAWGYYPSGFYGELGSFYGYELLGLTNALALGGI